MALCLLIFSHKLCTPLQGQNVEIEVGHFTERKCPENLRLHWNNETGKSIPSFWALSQNSTDVEECVNLCLTQNSFNCSAFDWTVVCNSLSFWCLCLPQHSISLHWLTAHNEATK